MVTPKRFFAVLLLSLVPSVAAPLSAQDVSDSLARALCAVFPPDSLEYQNCLDLAPQLLNKGADDARVEEIQVRLERIRSDLEALSTDELDAVMAELDAIIDVLGSLIAERRALYDKIETFSGLAMLSEYRNAIGAFIEGQFPLAEEEARIGRWRGLLASARSLREEIATQNVVPVETDGEATAPAAEAPPPEGLLLPLDVPLPEGNTNAWHIRVDATTHCRYESLVDPSWGDPQDCETEISVKLSVTDDGVVREAYVGLEYEARYCTSATFDMETGRFEIQQDLLDGQIAHQVNASGRVLFEEVDRTNHPLQLSHDVRPVLVDFSAEWVHQHNTDPTHRMWNWRRRYDLVEPYYFQMKRILITESDLCPTAWNFIERQNQQ